MWQDVHLLPFPEADSFRLRISVVFKCFVFVFKHNFPAFSCLKAIVKLVIELSEGAITSRLGTYTLVTMQMNNIQLKLLV